MPIAATLGCSGCYVGARGEPSRRYLGLALLWAAMLIVVAPQCLAAEVADTMHQRVRPCLSCHTGQSIQMESGYAPRLRGKPAGYLFNQLVNFREGRRANGAMSIMVAHLSDDYLAAMARYFSDIQTAYPAPAPVAADASLQARGRELVTHGDPGLKVPACQACHGERLTGILPNTPSLLGLPRDYLMAQLGAWRVGSRHAAKPDCMRKIAGRLRESDIQAVASWLASRPPPADTRPRKTPVSNPPLACGSVPIPE